MPARASSGTVLALALIGWACSGDSVAGPGPRFVPEGVWGGRGARLEVTAEGAEVEFDCAHGAMGPLELDDEGRFEVEGTYTLEGPRPVRPLGPASEPAIYTGGLEGDDLTLEVERESGAVVGPYELSRGQAGRVLKCL
jgi:hypothetical protein